MLGINIQFYCRFRKRIIIRTIGCIELSQIHTSRYLQIEVYKILDRYEINRRNIYSFTCDNGANMLCLGKLRRQMQHVMILTDLIHEERKKIESQENEESDIDSEDPEIEFQFDYGDENHAQITKEVASNILTSFENPMVDGLLSILIVFRCAAHTLQLAVHDVLSMVSKTQINHIRSVVKKLKSSKHLDIMPVVFQT
jgi:hypothetical protein